MEVKEEWSPPDGGYGWIIVFATTLINVTVLPLIQCFGIIYEDDLRQLGVSAAEISFLLHLQSSIYCSLGIFSSPLLKIFNYRQVSLMGAALMCLGVFLSSFANSYIFLIFSVSIFMGIGQGILIPATYVATNSYFKKRLTIAVSLSVTGASLSPIFMPKICDILLTNLGVSYTVLILFFFSLLSIPSCVLLKPIKRKREIMLEVSNELTEPQDIPDKKDNVLEKLMNDRNSVYHVTTLPAVKTKTSSVLNKLYTMFDLDLLKDKSFILVIVGLGISFASELNIIIMMQFILSELCGFKRSEVAFAASIQSITDVIGRLAIPFLSHQCDVSPKIMYSGSLIASTVARAVLAGAYDTRGAVLFCCALVGLAKGSKAVFQSVIIPKYVPLEKLPAATGLNMLFTGTVSLIIGPIIGSIHDTTKSYVYALHTATILSMLCILMWIVEYFYSKKKPK